MVYNMEQVPIWIVAYQHGERRVSSSRLYLPRIEVLDDMVRSAGMAIPKSMALPYKGSERAMRCPYLAGIALVVSKSSSASALGVSKVYLEERMQPKLLGREFTKGILKSKLCLLVDRSIPVEALQRTMP